MEKTAIPGGQAARLGEFFQLFRDGSSHTRSELGELTGLSRSTILTRMDALLQSSLIRPGSGFNFTGGRPSTQFEFNPGAGYTLGVDLGARHAIVAVTDLDGTVLGRRRRDVELSDGPEQVLDWIGTSANEVLEELALESESLVGTGIGFPAPVQHSSGRPVAPPRYPGWDRFDIPAAVQRRLPGPVFVDNDVNLLALGEHASAWSKVDDLLYIKLATGIGCGIVLGGILQRGAKGTAGDISHWPVPHGQSSAIAGAGQFSVSELASGASIALHLSNEGIEAQTSKDVVELVRQGNERAISAVRQAGRQVGEIVAMIVNLLNPAVVVVGGSLAEAGEYLIAGVRETVYGTSIPAATEDLLIVKARIGDNAGVIGAARMVINEVLEPVSVEALIQRRLMKGGRESATRGSYRG